MLEKGAKVRRAILLLLLYHSLREIATEIQKKSRIFVFHVKQLGGSLFHAFHVKHISMQTQCKVLSAMFHVKHPAAFQEAI